MHAKLDTPSARFLATPGRVAVAGDWHGDTSFAVRQIHAAANAGANAIVHVGDFGYLFLPVFRDSLDEALDTTGLTLGFVDGNHEDFDWLYRNQIDPDTGLRPISAHMVHIPRGYRWTWGKLTLMGLGGAHSVDRHNRRPGESWWEQETLTDADVEYASRPGLVDVIFSHDAPSTVAIPGLERTAHLFAQRELDASQLHREKLTTVVQAVQPRALYHGHYHAAYEQLIPGSHPTIVRGLSDNYGPAVANLHVDTLGGLAT